MASLNSIGLPALAKLRHHSSLPIHGHRNGWGMIARCPALGISFPAMQKMWRLAGGRSPPHERPAEQVLRADDSVVASARACLTPQFGDRRVMPVLSSGQWAGQAPDTYRRLESVDLLYLCGGGILAHAGGPAAGVASIRQAWEAALEGRSLEQAASLHSELRQAIETYSNV
jgi:ribulose-bisphosphate carboxylase large chain